MKFVKNSFLLQLTVTFCALLILQSCDDSSTNIREPQYNPPAKYDLSQADTSYTTESGLEIYVIEEGYGDFEVISRDQIRANYTGYRLNGEVFESTFRNGVTSGGILRNLRTVPISGASGTVSPLIDGFRQGLLGMKEGEKRTLIIPPSLGYGDAREGTNSYELRNDTLRFDVEVLQIL